MLNQLPDFLLPCEEYIYILCMSYVPYSTAYMKHYSTLSSGLFFLQAVNKMQTSQRAETMSVNTKEDRKRKRLVDMLDAKDTIL